MSNHILVPVKWATTPDGKQYSGRCKECGWTAAHAETAQAVQEEFISVHLREVTRVRANLRKTEPGTEEMRNYYLEKAADRRTPRSERDLWQQLANELKPRWRPGDRSVSPDDVPLI